MGTALDHPRVAGYLRELESALAGPPPEAAAELSEQLRAHLSDALPDDADDDTVHEVLAALGPASLVAAAADEPASGNASQASRRPPRLHRAVAAARRLPARRWMTLAALVNATQDTVPLRPGHIQGFAVFVYNPSDMSQRILGAPADAISPGAPAPPQIAVSTTGSPRVGGEPRRVAYRAGGVIPPHSYRWLRVLWRSYQCYLEGPGGSQGTDSLALRVKVGWITRTEVIALGTDVAVSPTTRWPAWCSSRPPQPWAGRTRPPDGR